MRILSKIFVLFTLTFLYGCASGVSIINNNEIYVGMSKSQLRNVHLKTYMGDDPFISGSFSNFDFTKKNEIISGANKKVFFVFENVDKPIKCGFLCDYGNGKLKSWHYSYIEAKNSLTKDIKQIQKQPKLILSSNDNSNENYIKLLNNLIKDFENGIITEEEFNKKKSEILK
jgi:hypothetical protein